MRCRRCFIPIDKSPWPQWLMCWTCCFNTTVEDSFRKEN